jgi:hypothetical protein
MAVLEINNIMIQNGCDAIGEQLQLAHIPNAAHENVI